MRTETVTVRHGEDMGPIDWSHNDAKDMPEIWHEAEKKPEDFQLHFVNGFKPREVYKICMYDGWPYWKPMPALLVSSPMGGTEWVHFTSYGIDGSSIRRKP